MNRAPEPGSAPRRVVSLVPWMTDTMTAFGLDGFLAGVSDSCPLPAPRTVENRGWENRSRRAPKRSCSCIRTWWWPVPG